MDETVVNVAHEEPRVLFNFVVGCALAAQLPASDTARARISERAPSALTHDDGSKEAFDKAPLLASISNLMTECRTVSVSIQSPPDQLYDYLADATRFPEWSAFITKIVPDGAAWRATTPLGTLHFEFEPRNPYRILDHTVTTADGTRIHVPMRVVPNASDGSEVMLSVFRQPDMSDEQYLADIATVRDDLASLKRVIES